MHPHYTTLHYVLLFARGEQGWHKHLKLQPGVNGAIRTQNGTVSQTLYYAYHLHIWPPEWNSPVLFWGGRLLQQYIVDAWATTEQSKLNWVRFNQKTLRSDLYNGLRDAAANTDHLDLNDVGQKIVLPSSHLGSPRHMYQLFQDSMAICRYFHKPDLFITMTANPKWPEIVNSLLSGQSAEDRPDIVARVFNQKKNDLLKRS